MKNMKAIELLISHCDGCHDECDGYNDVFSDCGIKVAIRALQDLEVRKKNNWLEELQNASWEEE